MCGLLVVTNHTFEEPKLDASFNKLYLRGPDMTQKSVCHEGVFCFQRLAIMDLKEEGMQPFTFKKHMLVANAEIYNYKWLHQTYANAMYTDELFPQKRCTYDVNPPISKEALLYREIFESFYPNHDHVIPSYWMPNQTWEHCNVDDPSARVLKNYGKSGE